MAVEQETTGILFFLALERELGPISGSDEDLTALVDLACSIWAFWHDPKCVSVYFG